ncbi:MAG: hypothetical protein E7452_04565 [Ruminococcaceae bacterium]|nr:hypothetical protein [Oscillospiraceae bacterium]
MTPTVMSAQVFDSGKFRVEVPDGWKLFCGTDSDGKPTPKKVFLYKGASCETDIFTHAGITICFFGKEDLYFSPKDFYDNVVDIEQFMLGNYTWGGYTCTSLGYPYTMLEARPDGCVFQVMILTKNGEYEISLEDTDVRRLLASIAVPQ